MLELVAHQEICRQFAVLLSYPDDHVAEQTAACLAGMREICPEGAAFLESFQRFVEISDSCRVEEAFTGTFDLQSLCHPYVGYQLCGESQQRTMFMLKLKEIYHQFDFTQGHELPDHLSEVLRFIGSTTDQDCRRVIIQDGLLPALAKITQGIESDGHPYMAMLFALQSFLQETVEVNAAQQHAGRQKECLS